MPEIVMTPPHSASELRTLLRAHLSHLDPAWNVLAEEILGLDGRIDLVALDGRGRVVVGLIGLSGEDDRALLTRLLAQRSWVAPRIRDWAQLAPELELDPGAPIRAVLFAPDFRPETLAAADSMTSDPPELTRYTAVQSGTRKHLLLKPIGSPAPAPLLREAQGSEAYTAESSRAVFRSGLTDLDLGLSGGEIKRFEEDDPNDPRGEMS